MDTATRLRSSVRHGWAALAVAIGLAGCGPAAPPPKVQVSIASDGDYLAFRPETLTVPAGADVVLTFHHGGSIISQAHDWVLAKPGTMPALLAEVDRRAAAEPTDTEGKQLLTPGDPRVIAATRPIGKGETTTIEFIAPSPGDYPFFCSTPGHGESMHGVLHVTRT